MHSNLLKNNTICMNFWHFNCHLWPINLFLLIYLVIKEVFMSHFIAEPKQGVPFVRDLYFQSSGSRYAETFENHTPFSGGVCIPYMPHSYAMPTMVRKTHSY